MDALDSRIATASTQFVTENIKNASDVVKKIYDTISYDGNPFFDWYPPETQTRTYRNQFTQLSVADQENQVLGYLYGSMKATFSSNELSNLFSPSSGQLNFVALGHNLYRNAKLGKFPTELSALNTINYSYRSNYSFTGRQCYHMYVNNFIGEDTQLSASIETHKNDDYIYVTTNFVTATTAYTFSQAGIDTFNALKKCKTFKDYQTWFDGVKPELETRLKDDLLKQDTAVLKATYLLLNHFQHLLTQLAINEAPYLPKEEEKKPRGKKKKEEEVAEEEDVIEEVTLTAEDKAALLAALKGDI
jgi:hypothetical protein